MNHPYQVNLTAAATTDLQQIYTYISKQLLEQEAAKRLLLRLKEAASSLSIMPQRHALVIDNYLAKRGVHKLLVDRYLIFYTIQEKEHTVTILRILYAKRNWQSIV